LLAENFEAGNVMRNFVVSWRTLAAFDPCDSGGLWWRGGKKAADVGRL